MLCHKAKPKEGIVKYCAGWMAQVNGNSIGYRLLAIQGKIDTTFDNSGGHDLFTFEQMMRANVRGWKKPKSDIEQIRENRHKVKA